MGLKRRNVLLGLMGLSLPLIASSCGGNAPTATSGSSPATSDTAASAGSGQMPKQIRIGYQVSPTAELLAKALGLAKPAFPNVDVEYISFDSGRDVNTAMAAKGIDFGLIGSVAVGVGIAQGLPYKVYFIQSVIGEAEALVAKGNIKTIADIKGKKIAVPFGSTTHYSMLSLLKLENINQNQLTIIDMQPPDMVAAWKRGDIDGGFVWQPHLGRLQQDGGTILTSSADLAKRGVITADLGVVHNDFLAKYPDAVKQYVAVLDKAVKSYRQDAQAAAKAMSSELGISPEETQSVMGQKIWLDASEQATPEYLGTPDKPGVFAQVLKDASDFMVTQKIIAKAPELAIYQKSIRNEFLQSS
jgi:taurine transport system substrate-binding protein